MNDPVILLQMLVLLMATGAVAGVLAGLLGVGGGIVLVPAFYYAFSLLGFESDHLMQICLATSLATIIVTSVRSVSSHHKKGAVDWSILRNWAPSIGLGALAGMTVASNLTSGVLQIIFATLAAAVGLYMTFGKASWRLAESLPQGLKRWFIGPVLGGLSVLMGIGGGSFGVPFMALHGVAIHRAVATAAGFGVIIAAPAVVGFLFVDIPQDLRPPFTIGAVNLVAFGVVIAMTLLTAPLGVRLAHSMNPVPLKRAFGVFLVLVALNMLRKVLGG